QGAPISGTAEAGQPGQAVPDQEVCLQPRQIPQPGLENSGYCNLLLSGEIILYAKDREVLV
ncbi:MAG TPA: hypothetical protein VGF67_14165, partial [Ktedonobacteraceae bacterium]